MELFSVDLFRIFNFILIISVLFVLFRTYILPDVTIVVAEKEMMKKKLYIKQQSLEDALFALTNDVIAENSAHEELQKKILAWKVLADQRSIESIDTENMLRQRFEKRCNDQLRERMCDVARRKEVVSVISSIVAQVQIKYGEKKYCELFQDMVISSINFEKDVMS